MAALPLFHLEAIAMIASPLLASESASSTVSTTTRNRRIPDFSDTIGREECPDANHLNTCYDLEAYNLFDECECVDLEESHGVSFVCMQGDYLWCEGRSEASSNIVGDNGGKTGGSGNTLDHQTMLPEDSLGMDDVSLQRGDPSLENKRKVQVLRTSVAVVVSVALLALLVRSASCSRSTAAQAIPSNTIDTAYRDGEVDQEMGHDELEEANEKGKILSQVSHSIELATFT